MASTSCAKVRPGPCQSPSTCPWTRSKERAQGILQWTCPMAARLPTRGGHGIGALNGRPAETGRCFEPSPPFAGGICISRLSERSSGCPHVCQEQPARSFRLEVCSIPKPRVLQKVPCWVLMQGDPLWGRCPRYQDELLQHGRREVALPWSGLCPLTLGPKMHQTLGPLLADTSRTSPDPRDLEQCWGGARVVGSKAYSPEGHRPHPRCQVGDPRQF